VSIRRSWPRWPLCRPWEAVICADNAHAHVDEGGAPEKVAGLKLLTVPHVAGKITPELVDRQAWGFGVQHRAQPRVVSVTQSTELGTVYTVEEIAALAEHAHGLGLLLHMDGARVSIAAAALDGRAGATSAPKARLVRDPCRAPGRLQAASTTAPVAWRYIRA
jgi:threonine aldolase